ncbi:hypothetical protein SISSUDRAFT_1068790 [Sistotremastrum suecicum HHB10207 ss-3]|uniref:Uncharacterized protein n=1 Tax=Sistotremastrum suecicum HHB10207 ss-3 TaxID=1314776 RepID=A0A166I8L1_9AGAM|nr:hypothetical protein SISSUDRAFT_1068790 [Sistotremastrum suecicum HHB10207 ss-3]
MNVPALRGDKSGAFRVHVVGNSGAGMPRYRLEGVSTLGAHIAARLNVPFIALDHYGWQPSWVETDVADFRARVGAKLAEDPKGWVVDGVYSKKLGLDPPFPLLFWRLFLRTIGRIIGTSPPCAPGCDESLRQTFLSKDSILWWAISVHRKLRRRLHTMMEADDRVQRIGGWGGQLQRWLSRLEGQIRQRA